mmetsp:Transcript_49215/g.123346  ORF Transcript_49215/g.123346 Transcript_49215/m.123346 type:complete len:85 (+) Transcript_49215:435-689(+)
MYHGTHTHMYPWTGARTAECAHVHTRHTKIDRACRLDGGVHKTHTRTHAHTDTHTHTHEYTDRHTHTLTQREGGTDGGLMDGTQ